METYTYRGKEGENIPQTVQKLIVAEGIQVLPDRLCYRYDERLQTVSLPNGLKTIGASTFGYCGVLLEISIGSTVQAICHGAFEGCHSLREVDFEVCPGSHQLQKIHKKAFYCCYYLERIKLPSSVTSLGNSAFGNCSHLVQANLLKTSVTQTPFKAFSYCCSLQAIMLPITLERICDNAFAECLELVTIVLPLGSQSIDIGSNSFDLCRQLANLTLPKQSTVRENSFEYCHLLHDRFGEDSEDIVAGLINRFENFPVHRMCYDHSEITAQQLRQCIQEQDEERSLLDKFEMSPFHVFFSTVEPRVELLDCLLESLPNQLLKNEDANCRRPLDYLIRNWTDETKRLFQMTLQKSMINRLDRWGSMSWMEEIQSKINDVLSEGDMEGRGTLCDQAYSLFERYENVQATSILEMALWKTKIKSGWASDGTKRKALDREECRCLCGSDIVIPQIATFLGI